MSTLPAGNNDQDIREAEPEAPQPHVSQCSRETRRYSSEEPNLAATATAKARASFIQQAEAAAKMLDSWPPLPAQPAGDGALRDSYAVPVDYAAIELRLFACEMELAENRNRRFAELLAEIAKIAGELPRAAAKPPGGSGGVRFEHVRCHRFLQCRRHCLQSRLVARSRTVPRVRLRKHVGLASRLVDYLQGSAQKHVKQDSRVESSNSPAAAVRK